MNRNGIAPILLLALASLLHSGCGRSASHKHPPAFSAAYLDEAQFAQAMGAALGDGADTGRKNRLSAGTAMRAAYRENEFLPLWVGKDRIAPAVSKLADELESLTGDGIPVSRYPVAQIRQLIARLDGKKTLDVASAVQLDTLCTSAWMSAAHDLRFGLLVPKRVDSLWYHANDSSWNADALLVKARATEDGYPELAAFRSKIQEYHLLRERAQQLRERLADSSLLAQKREFAADPTDSLALTIAAVETQGMELELPDSLSGNPLVKWQALNGFAANGKLDSATRQGLVRTAEEAVAPLYLNMERLRWLPDSLEASYVWVNIPQMEMRYTGEGEGVRMRVVVGKPVRQTPSLNARMVNIVFNPSWGVPPTILRNDVLPGLNKSGAGYLRRKGLKAYDRNGNVVDGGSINQSNYKRYTYKQSPGDDNSLGVVKFNLPNPWDIYLHDTPHRGDFPKSYRALSSGCIRLAQPRQFAEFILTKLEGRDKFSASYIDSVVQTHKTRYEILKHKIPVHIVYLTAGTDSTGRLRLYRDIYGRDRRLAQGLQRLSGAPAEAAEKLSRL